MIQRWAVAGETPRAFAAWRIETPLKDQLDQPSSALVAKGRVTVSVSDSYSVLKRAYDTMRHAPRCQV